jgi:hypothetical protein
MLQKKSFQVKKLRVLLDTLYLNEVKIFSERN